MSDQKAKSVAALIINSLREMDVYVDENDELTDVLVDGTFDLLALSRAIVTEVRSDYE